MEQAKSRLLAAGVDTALSQVLQKSEQRADLGTSLLSATISTFLNHLTLKVAAADASEVTTRIRKTVVGAVGGAITGGEAGAAAGAIGALVATEQAGLFWNVIFR